MLRTRPSRHADAPVVAAARLWAEVDLDAVRQNVRSLRARLRHGCALLAVVKADGYGHGAEAVARAALDAGAAGLAVGDAFEGARLRAAGIDARILIVGPSAPADAPAIVRHRLVASVADLRLAQALAAHGGRGPIDVEVEIDTGMRRHGVLAAGAPEFVRGLRTWPALRLCGFYTHFAGHDAAAVPATRRQFETFLAVLRTLAPAGAAAAAHACNTLAACLLPEAHLDAVRVGGGIYGFDPGVPGIALRPALALKTRVAALRAAAAGDRVGYGGVFRCSAATTLALLPCGYADGLPRALWDGAEVLVRGLRARVAGLVSMNQMTVDVGAVPDVAVGDEVVLLGAQGGERVRAEDRVGRGGSPYEVTCLLRPDLLRVYRGAAAGPPFRR
jgi:alanine racemase